MSTLIALPKYGITRSELHSALVNRFSLTDKQVKACHVYYILHWEGGHFKSQLSNGVISRGMHSYLVVYKDCKPTDILPDTKLHLSFRKAYGEFELPGYVLISLEHDTSKKY